MKPDNVLSPNSLPPFVPDEMIFLVQNIRTRTLEDDAVTRLEAIVGEHGGYLEHGGRSLDMPLIEQSG